MNANPARRPPSKPTPTSMSAARQVAAVALAWALGTAAAASAADGVPDEEPGGSTKQSLLELHLRHAELYEMTLDAEGGPELELQRTPVYVWTNPTRNHGQEGAVFVWTEGGRPHVVASIFSHPEDGDRIVNHELHTLSPHVVQASHPGPDQWEPRAGLRPEPVPDAPAPAEDERPRGLQLRTLARRFSAATVHPNTGERYELRLLPQPLHRYTGRDGDVLDGALFAFATSAGTDPEMILLLEARRTAAGPSWHYALARFTDLNLFARLDGEEIWSAVRAGEDTWLHDAKHTYRLMLKQQIPAEAGGE